MRSITLTQLTEHNACIEQAKLFKQHFGESVEVTQELAESVASVFSWGWAAVNLLSADGYKLYAVPINDAANAYNDTCDAADVVYNTARSDAFKVYEAATGEGYKAYLAACAKRKNLYDETGDARYAYETVTAEPHKIYIASCNDVAGACSKARNVASNLYGTIRAATFARIYNEEKPE